MIVFNDGRYYQIIEDLECLKEWVTNVKTTNIFCARNVTNYFDQPYNYTIWPEDPTCFAMEVYKKYNIWKGITVSKINKNYTELYWFTKKNAKSDWHKYFIRNKFIMQEFIKYFDSNKEIFINENKSKQNLFKFTCKFDSHIPSSEYIKEESLYIKKYIHLLKYNSFSINRENSINLSPREVEVLAYVGRGYPVKSIALKLFISKSTVKTHIENIKLKNNLHSKIDLIKFFESNILK